MISVAGIFSTRESAQGSIDKLRSIGTPYERLILLFPGIEDKEVEDIIPKVETDDRGRGEKIGGAVGRGIGIAGGIMLGGAVGSVFVPGVGVVVAAGVLAAALLGTGGAAIGAATGGAVDERAAADLRHDQLHLYEAALRQGRSVLVALANDEREAQKIGEVLADAGAENIDDARENWWSELRSAEEAAYKNEGRDFALDEALYQRGFEAAQHPLLRGKTVTESAALFGQYFGDDHLTEAFQRGYKRGQAYHQDLLETFPAQLKTSQAGAKDKLS